MSDIWSWDDVPGLERRPPPERKPFSHGGTKRPHGGSLSRFQGTSHHGRQDWAALRADHPAVVEGRTLFPSTVVGSAAAPRLLVSGNNSAKIGGTVMKGAWRGMPIFTLTLEERATCPSSCGHWRTCYGNAMPLSRRHRADADLIPLLEQELRAKSIEHRQGFVVRLHVLGDFYSSDYVMAWARWMNRFPALRVFGYTAHPRSSDIGDVIEQMNEHWPERWVVRFSVAHSADRDARQVTTIWRQPANAHVPEGLVCPMQQDRTQACATCGLCWAPAAAEQRIVFIGHGMAKRGRKS